MKKLIFILCFVLSFSLMFIPLANATRVTVNLEDLPTYARNAILNLGKKKDKNEIIPTKTLDEETISKVERMGVALGKSLNALVKELGVTLNEFIKTDVGKLSAFLLVWKLIGKELLSTSLRIVAFFFAVGLWLFSFMRFHVPYREKIKDPETKEIKINWKKKYEFTSADARGASTVCHGIIIIVLFIVFILVV